MAWIGLPIYLIAVIAALVVYGLAEARFFRIYDERIRPERPLSRDQAAGNDPVRFFKGAFDRSSRSYQALFAMQPDDIVEAARRRAVAALMLAICTGCFGMLLAMWAL